MLQKLLTILFPARSDEALLKEAFPEAFLALLAPELVPLGAGEGAAALLPYADPLVRAAIHEAKYRGSDRAFALLASALTDYLREEPPARAVLVPIPLGAKRRAERGYNQVEEVLRLVARELALPLDTTLLERTRETASQVALPRWRRAENLRGAMRITRPLDPRLLYIVVDDVVTTGATFSAALAALRAGGAREIAPLAFAH